jgi:uncharacterized protein YbjQ (UPF0145 family)
MSAAARAFTSDLSVSGYALCDRLGLRPIHQVMGSSIYQVGYQGSTWPMMMGGTILTELDTLSQAWNEVRENALGRMEREARDLGAHAVVGVQLRIGSHDWAEGAIEYVVLGTAVQRKGVPPTDHPILTELSVSDYAKLVQAGMEPAGIAAWSSVFFAAYSFNPVLGMGGSPSGQMGQIGQLGGLLSGTAYNYELREFTRAFYSAREQVMENMNFQAKKIDASGIVGVRIEHSARRHTIGGGPSLGGGGERNGLIVEFHAIGTAIKETAGAQAWPPEMTIDLNS